MSEEKLYTLSEAKLILEKQELEYENSRLQAELLKKKESMKYWREEWRWEYNETARLNKTINELIETGDMFALAVEAGKRSESFVKTLGKWNKATARIIEERKNSVINVAGEFYPCKPDIFERTYEEVSE